MEKVAPPKIDLEKKLITDAQAQSKVERQVIVHVSISTGHSWWQIRIWPSTFLIPREGGEKSKLLNADKIPFFPQWLHVFGPKHHFTLIFEGLPKDCEEFDLVEEIPQEGGFEVLGICRNQTDVYHVEIFD
ncbi:hypothetical protein [Mongoliibacter ruber]|uniref:Uncharacterized protein n=1 Tax=Mongoliibacter ruber TaxID=1750599 RepID=A0A2T0WCX1_9BACT|nr:hypothetical protein [Mongoliibacter ruber]PRY84551.1 hypothetical protein CLW00_11912 [Mongoliibacter ruber]